MIHEPIITDTENTQADTYFERSIISIPDDTSGLWFDYETVVNDALQELLTIGKTVIFEDGMNSRFSEYLTILLSSKHGVGAVEVISNLIIKEQVSPPIAREILKLFGDFEYPNPELARRIFDALLRGLNTRFVDIKDGAILGLASIDDPKAIPYLKKAIERENNNELKDDMQQVLEQLIETREEKD